MARWIAVLVFGFAAFLPGAGHAMEGFAPLGLKIERASSFAEQRGDRVLRNSPVFAGAIGLQVSENFWLEGERLSRRVESANGFAAADMTMVNLSFQPDIKGPVTPFITAGAGLAHQDGIRRDSAGFATAKGEAGASFAWQLGGGLQYRAGDELAVTGSYRYLDGGSLGFDQGLSNYNDHEFWLRADFELKARRNLEPLKGSRHYDE